jgi:capsular polysaccharide biosynthesis protein
MRLQDYIQVLLKRWWLILLVALSAGSAAYVFSKMSTPIYRSRAIYTVLFNRLDTGGNFFAADLFNGYISLVYQPDRMEYINQQLGLDRSGSELMEFVRLQAQPDQRQIVIEADWYDSETSQRLANAVGSLLNARVVEANRNLQGEDRAFLDLSQRASPGGLAKPQTKINVLAGLLLGGVLGVLLAFVLEFMDDTLKTATDVERFAGLVTVGAIPSSGALPLRRVRARPALASGIIAGSPSRPRDSDPR